MNLQDTSLLNIPSARLGSSRHDSNGASSTGQRHEQSSEADLQRAQVPNYRPVALRWWFLAVLGFLFALFGGLLELAIHKLPVKDNDGGIILPTRAYHDQGFQSPGNDLIKLVGEWLNQISQFTQLEVPSSSYIEGRVVELAASSTHFLESHYLESRQELDKLLSYVMNTNGSNKATKSKALPSNIYHVYRYNVSVVPSATSRTITFIRPERFSDLTTATQKPVLRTVQKRVPSDWSFGSWGARTVTSYNPPPASTPPTTPVATPAATEGVTHDISIAAPTSSNAPETHDEEPTPSPPPVAASTDPTSAIVTAPNDSTSPNSASASSLPVESVPPTGSSSSLVSMYSSSYGARSFSTEPVPTPTMAPNATMPPSTTDVPPVPSGGFLGAYTELYFISQADYFLGTFAATLVTSLLSIVIRIINLNAQRFQPWHELTSPGGATAAASLCRKAGSLHGFFRDLSHLFRGRWPPLTLLTASMIVFSTLATSFSSEVFAVVTHGSCSAGGADNCAWTLAISVTRARIVQVLLFIVAFQIALAPLILREWRSGVYRNPWSIAGTASLLGHPGTREILGGLSVTGARLPDSRIRRELAPYTFELDHFYTRSEAHYGIVVSRNGELNGRIDPLSFLGLRNQPKNVPNGVRRKRRGNSQPFFALSVPGRILMLGFVLGVIGLIGYYNGPQTTASFEQFIDSESFGVRLLFTAIGIIVTFAWGAFFTGVSYLTPYRRMARSPEIARRSIEISPPTNSFSGFYSAIVQRDFFMGLVAGIGMLSEFLPVLLSNVPYQITQTREVHLISTWISVGIMGIMVFIIGSSFFVRWPPFPVDVRTIAGAAYYVCDSRLALGTSSSDVNLAKGLHDKISVSHEKYTFGEMVGVSGRRRVGVNVHEDSSTAEAGTWGWRNGLASPQAPQ
ncbi:hypothetical protein GGR57DRAFT_475058 [Xylariaceae sp. FL1272]|nr:hypothetical protein GGR57DRAFT_475058 [Xylariaceae sp. FL1272]